MNFEQEFTREFGNKYNQLHFKSAVVKKNEGSLVVTFLYSSAEKELADEEKTEITNWLKSQLKLEKIALKVKFLRVFVEERLIQKAIKDFFDRKHKLISTYLKDDSFSVKCTPFDVQVQVELSPRLQELFNEHKVQDELGKFLKESFLVDFAIIPHVNNDLVDEVDIDNVEMKTTYKLTPKHKVEIIKNVAGTGFSRNSIKEQRQIEGMEDTETHEYMLVEYISNIRAAKENATIAGYLRKIERKDYVIKKGKRVGQEKAYYPFVVQDFRGKMDCVYFCPKVYVPEMEKLEETMFVLVHGDVRPNQSGRLQLIADKIALAEPVKEKVQERKPVEPDGNVVEIEKLSAVEQDSMFGRQNKYNKKIMGRTIVVFDCETTGLNREDDEIIEIGAVKIDDGNIIEKFSTFVKPSKPIPYAVTKLTGITQDMVKNAPPIEAVIKDFYKFSEGCVLSGHNVIDFDIHFIKRAGALVGLDFDNELIDTMNEARVARLKISKFNLATVTRVLGISLEGAHRAWNDAFATAQVLLRLNSVGGN